MAFYPIEEHEYRYRPLGGSFTAWTPCTPEMAMANNRVSIPVGDIEIAEGDMQVRVMASGSRPAGSILSSPAAFTLAVVEPGNVAPIASAGADNTITLPADSVTLTGSGTDSDGAIASYLWEQTIGAAATITTPNAATTTVTGLAEGVYEFRLTVTDDQGATHQDTVQITVNPETTMTTPDAPTAFVVNNFAKTFDWTDNPSFAALSDLEYTITSGVEALPMTGKPQPIPNNDYAPGTVGIRVKADPGTNRLASAWLYNSTAFTYNPDVKANVVFVGNSIVNPGGFPAIADQLLPSDYVITNVAISGQTLTSMQNNIQTQLLDRKNPNATHNVVVIMEGTNQLVDTGISASQYYDTMLTNYSNQARSAGWKVVNITIPPNSWPNGVDINPRAKVINTAMIANTTGISDRVVNLGGNFRVGSFGTAAFGQDSGYSSFNTNYYSDGIHPTPFVQDIIGHMVADVLRNLIDGASIPDPAIYPVEANLVPVEWVNIVNATVTAENAIYDNTGTDYQAGASSKKGIASTGSAGLQGLFKFNPYGNPGFTLGGGIFGLSNTGGPGTGFSSIRHAFYINNTIRIMEAGTQVFNTNIVKGSTTDFKIELYDNGAKYYVNDALVYTSSLAPIFPAFVDLTFGRNDGVKNANLNAVNLVDVF